MNSFVHLVKRFIFSLDRRNLAAETIEVVREKLTEKEYLLWSQMPLIDKKHSIIVMRRFLEQLPNAEIAAVRASLLHDVGKTESNLGVISRVVATIVGSRGRRFSQYHDHEKIGGKILRQIDSDATTCRLVSGEFADIDERLSVFAQALRDADNI